MNLSNRIRNDKQFIPDKAFVNRLQEQIEIKNRTKKFNFLSLLQFSRFLIIPAITLVIILSVFVIQNINKNNIKAYATEGVRKKLEEYKTSPKILYTKSKITTGKASEDSYNEVWIDVKNKLYKTVGHTGGFENVQIVKGETMWSYSTQTLASKYIQKNIGKKYIGNIFETDAEIVVMLEELLNNPNDSNIVEQTKYNNTEAYVFIQRSNPKDLKNGTLSYQYFRADNFDYLGEKYYKVVNGNKSLYVQTEVIEVKEIDNTKANIEEIFSIDLSKFPGVKVRVDIDNGQPNQIKVIDDEIKTPTLIKD